MRNKDKGVWKDTEMEIIRKKMKKEKWKQKKLRRKE